MASPANQKLRDIPSVDELLRSNELNGSILEYGRPQVLAAVRQCVADVRRLLLADEPVDFAGDPVAQMAGRVQANLDWLNTPSQVRVFNLTGTIIHTNLGRAPLPEEAITAMSMAARHPSNLEFDLQAGRRGDRDNHLENLICRLTGAEAATIVNNNAAAVMLVLNTLALRKQVLVSRGQLIEIGGSFRMPDIMKRAGAKLHEVGTTNRTHPDDFRTAIGPATNLIMEVHTSNYLINGFTGTVPTSELAKLAHQHDLPLMVDLGSGTLVDLEQLGLPHEPTVGEVVGAGTDVVTFSGDKLLGGPQAGFIVGNADLIARIKRNPMKRAMRVDKMTIAALEAVLQLYGDPQRAVNKIPVLRMLNRSAADVATQAKRLLPEISRALNGMGTAQVVACKSQVGSGALPTTEKESSGIAIAPSQSGKTGPSLRGLSEGFLQLPVPVIGRLTGNRFVMDVRCLDDEHTFVSQLQELNFDHTSAFQ